MLLVVFVKKCEKNNHCLDVCFSLITLVSLLRIHFVNDIWFSIVTGTVVDHQSFSIPAMKATLSGFTITRLACVCIVFTGYMIF